MGPGKLVRYMQNPSYTYDTYWDQAYRPSGPSYPSLPVFECNQIFCHVYDNELASCKFNLHLIYMAFNHVTNLLLMLVMTEHTLIVSVLRCQYVIHR